MILSENQLRIPGKMFKVRVKCISTRRLTTIEWLILSCTKKFNDSPSMSGKTLKYAFEEVFQFQNSELLIKPCLRNLSGLKVIRVAGDGNFDYNKLKFEDIEMTELGQYMLKEGLLPGDPREIPLDVYYNPLTGKMNNYDITNADSKEAVEFGVESDYDLNFPEKRIIEELQAGAVGGGRFTASKYRIEEVESITSVNWESIISMTVDVNDKGMITTNPAIIEEGMKNKIDSLFLTKEISRQVTNELLVVEKQQVQNIIGSGKRIKSAILEVCKNGRVLFMDANVYGLYKRNTASFKDTTIILFNDSDGFLIENEKALIIHIPDSFPIEGCVVVNEKGTHMCLGKMEYTYDGKDVVVPVVYENINMSKRNKIAIEWIQRLIRDHIDEDVQYVSLFTLPFLSSELKKCKEALFQRWDSMELHAIIEELDKIHLACIRLKTEMFKIDMYADALISKVDFSDYKNALQSIKCIMDTNCIGKNSESHRKMVEKIIGFINVPTTYRDLYLLLQSLVITNHDEALKFDDLIGGLYTNNIVEDILSAIALGTFTKMPELFEYDVFFNEYQECITSVELYVSGLKMFEKCNADSVEKSVRGCPDIAALQSYMAELRSKNAYLMTQQINVYAVLNKSMPEKAEAFIENMKAVEQYVNQIVNAEYEEVVADIDREKTEKNAVKKKIYILDTCALMHHPEIFMYFDDEEFIRIPTRVIDELGKIKDKRNKKYGAELADTARIIARDIDRLYLKIFNRKNKVRLMIENAAIDLLPKDLDPEVPDNQILSVAMKYNGWDTVIVSDDGIFRLAASAQNITSTNSEDFIEQHKDAYKSLDERIKETNGSNKSETLDKKEENIIDKNDAGTMADKIASVVGNMFSSEEKTELSGEKQVTKLVIDDLPIRELKKYVPDFNEPIFAYLQSNQIKTVGEFRMLTESRVRSFPAKGKQMVCKNTIMRAVKQMDSIISKIKLR